MSVSCKHIALHSYSNTHEDAALSTLVHGIVSTALLGLVLYILVPSRRGGSCFGNRLFQSLQEWDHCELICHYDTHSERKGSSDTKNWCIVKNLEEKKSVPNFSNKHCLSFSSCYLDLMHIRITAHWAYLLYKYQYHKHARYNDSIKCRVGVNGKEKDLHLFGSTPNWARSICPVRNTCHTAKHQNQHTTGNNQHLSIAHVNGKDE